MKDRKGTFSAYFVLNTIEKKKKEKEKTLCNLIKNYLKYGKKKPSNDGSVRIGLLNSLLTRISKSFLELFFYRKKKMAKDNFWPT